MAKNPAQATEITPEILIKFTNKERAKNNLEPLSYSHILEKAAKNKADDLLGKQYFSHTSPDNKTFIKWIKEVNYDYIYAGENLAMDFISSEGVIKAWMESESHKKNILSPNYSEIAIALSKGNFEGRPTIIITQLFGRPKNKSFLEKKDQNKLTLLNFNDIIKNGNEKKIILPSLLSQNEFSIAKLDKGHNIDQLNAAAIENRSPFLSSIKNGKNEARPKIAGESVFIKQSKISIFYKNFLVYLSLLFLFGITYIFSFGVNFLYKHILTKKFIYHF